MALSARNCPWYSCNLDNKYDRLSPVRFNLVFVRQHSSYRTGKLCLEAHIAKHGMQNSFAVE